MPPLGKLAQVLLPLGLYWWGLSFSLRVSKTLWWMFPILFLGAFNIVLSYLFGKGIIAVDMWLNLPTSDTGEKMEMLSQIYPAVLAVVFIYVPTLVYAAIDIRRKTLLDKAFRARQVVVGVSLVLVGLPLTFLATKSGEWAVMNDLFPINVCYNLHLAIARHRLSTQYVEDSKDFRYEAVAADTDTIPKVVVLVIGETSRACNWQLHGYDRGTTPLLCSTPGIAVFSDCISQSNTTHKSVPILLSPATADNYGVLYHSKGLFAAYDEAGYATVFLSNEPRNNSYNDFLGEQAKQVLFLRDSLSGTPMDSLLLPEVQKVLLTNKGNLMLVVHTYGSHSTYSDRYLRHEAYFTPDKVVKATKDNRDILINAYDNTIRYTDRVLHAIIQMLEKDPRATALLFTSDHGEDIYDDARNLFLHASPWPSYYQLHTPFFVWTSPTYRELYQERVQLMESRTQDPIQSDCVFPTILGLGGICSPYAQDSLALTSPHYVVKTKRTYLNDHNKPLPLDRCFEKEDFAAMRSHGLSTF